METLPLEVVEYVFELLYLYINFTTSQYITTLPNVSLAGKPFSF
jgi:hypothetical protein